MGNPISLDPMSDEDITELENAIELATVSHQGQRDKHGAPYILHALRVMLGLPARLMAAGVLHDVLEDCPVDLYELPDHGISGHTMDVVDAVTKRDGESYDDYLARVKANPDAVLVKRADISDNMHRMHALPQDVRQRLEEKYAKALLFLGESTPT